MQAAAHLDFQLYVALLASELPRFTIPGLGSFTWHVEKAHVDPRTGVVTPPKPTLKHEPGHRYQAETVAFLRDHFGLPEAEAEALLREVGRLAAAYLRTASEMDLWRLGKIKRVGGVYKVELHEEALPPIAVGLEEVNLRAGSAAVASLPKAAPPSSPSKGSEASRARVRQTSAGGPSEESSKVLPQPRPVRRWVPLVVGGIVLLAILGGGTFWLLRWRKPPQPVEIRLGGKSTASIGSEQRPPSSPSSPTTSSPTEAEKKASAVAPRPSPSAETPQKKTPPVPVPAQSEKAPSPPPAKAPKPTPPPKAAPAGPTYYIIVGSYPSRAEAEQKAAQFPGYKIEYLPGKEPGWVRLSVYSSTDKAAVQQRYREIKARVPDAWVFTAP
ncbi:MAG: hypothetical protein D6750_05865 [Bacteroidetes bacterium]|nr:MAG: hypothetical protein D6750_05865 [Bacteroidota bacterium]